MQKKVRKHLLKSILVYLSLRDYYLLYYSLFYNNFAIQGGAIFVGSPVSDCKINASFIDNSAYQGGAIFFNGTTDNCIIDGYFEGNDAAMDGGAVYCDKGQPALKIAPISSTPSVSSVSGT